MAYYRCILIGASDQTRAFEFGSDTDADAVSTCRRKLSDCPQHEAFELWRGSRRIHAELRETTGRMIEN
jgi:hypothetical protein